MPIDAVARGLASLARVAGTLITRAQIPASSGLPASIQMGGFATAGDLGAGAIYTSQGATSLGLMAIKSADGVWFNLVVNGQVTPGWFGAIGGSTDDTVAIQAAITYAVANASGVYIYAKHQITAPLNILGNVSRGFAITGPGYIQQMTSNTPILKFNGQFQSNIVVDGLTLYWSTNQSAANTGSVAILMVGNASPINNIFNCTFNNINIARAYAGFWAEVNTTFWGSRITNISYSSCSGPAFEFSLMLGGQPNMYLGNIYYGGSQTTDGPIVRLKNMVEMTIDNFEVNTVTNVQLLTATSCRNFMGRNWRAEQGTFQQDFECLIKISNTSFRLDGFELQSFTFPGTIPNFCFIFSDKTAGPGVPFYLNNLWVVSCTCNSKLYGLSTSFNPGYTMPFSLTGTTGYNGDVYPFDTTPGIVQAGYPMYSYANKLTAAPTGYIENSGAVSPLVLVAADIYAGQYDNVLKLTGNIAGPSNVQVPTRSQFYAALGTASAGGTYIGATWRLRIINSDASDTWTVITNTGWTLTGTMSIAPSTWRDFIITSTSMTAVSLTSIGTGTYS